MCTVTLTVKDDNLYEGGPGTTESVKIDLNAGGSSFNDGIKRASGYAPLSLTIEDNDLQPRFSIEDVSGPENGNLTFTVKREGALGNDVSVTAGTGNHAGATNSATADTDYAADTQKLDFESGIDTQTLTVAVTDDNIDEPDETFAVTLSIPVDNQGLPKPGIKPDGKTAVGTITDNDAAPAITLAVDADKDTDNVQDTLAENGGVKTVRVTATLDGTTRLEEAADLTLAVGKDGDSAVEGIDYTTVADQTITIGAGAASVTHDFILTPTDDDLYEGSETISLDGTYPALIRGGRCQRVGGRRHHLHRDPLRRHGQRGVGEVEHQGGHRWAERRLGRATTPR